MTTYRCQLLLRGLWTKLCTTRSPSKSPLTTVLELSIRSPTIPSQKVVILNTDHLKIVRVPIRYHRAHAPARSSHNKMVLLVSSTLTGASCQTAGAVLPHLISTRITLA